MTDYTAQNVVFGRDFLNTVLAALKTRPAAELIATGKVRLSQDPGFNPTPGSAIADFSPGEADYSGYAAGGIAYTVPDPVNLSATIQGLTVTVVFKAGTASPFVANSCTGWWLDDGSNVIMAERFANNGQAQFQSPGDFLALDTRLPMSLMQATA